MKMENSLRTTGQKLAADAAAACTDAAACSVVLSRDLVGVGWWGVVCTNIHGNSHELWFPYQRS